MARLPRWRMPKTLVLKQRAMATQTSTETRWRNGFCTIGDLLTSNGVTASLVGPSSA